MNNSAFNKPADYIALAKYKGNKEYKSKETKDLSHAQLVELSIGKVSPTCLAVVWNTVNRELGNVIDAEDSVKHMRSKKGKKELVDLAVNLMKG